jgi:glutamate racemase
MSPIGVFDSGFGGLTVLREFVDRLPAYDYLYLGDNGRTPYGTRSYETVYRYTLECVKWMLQQNCPLVILACNTASAKALRSIQQNDLKKLSLTARLLGVIRPTTEVIGNYTVSNQIGILATNGTVQSESYLIEIEKFFPQVKVVQEACPMWVPLTENGEHIGNGADYFIEKHVINILKSNPEIDTLLLACTHYPLLKEKIEKHLPSSVKLISQGEIVAKSLKQYLKNHSEMDACISKNTQRVFYTTDSSEEFNRKAEIFFGEPVNSIHVSL